MSLAKLKQKETKGKKSVLPKLRTVLANPYKHHSPVLADNDMEQFCRILEEAKARSGNNGVNLKKSFASQSHIHLGLASCLRAIHSQRFSCLLISLSLRPAHLIRLIATSAAVKIPTASIFAQPKLEELTFKLFGIKSMALALPLDLKNISEDLDNWVTAHKKPAPATHNVPSLKKKPIKKKKTVKSTPEILPGPVEELKPKPEDNKEKQWSGDYISCSNSETIDRKDSQQETQELGAALSNLAMKAKAKQVNTTGSKDQPKEMPQGPMEVEVQEPEQEDEFLPTDLSTYRSLTINVLRPNPNKKPKKKRNRKPATKTK